MTRWVDDIVEAKEPGVAAGLFSFGLPGEPGK
jgi:hypothetical protein